MIPATPAHRSKEISCAFIVLAHRNPAQIMRLVGRLAPAPIFLHVDARSPKRVHRYVREHAARYPSLTLIPRVRSPWASFGVIEATLRGLRMSQTVDGSHMAVLTGQDYPLVATSHIHAFARQHQGKSFVASWKLPSPLFGPDGGLGRVRYWHQAIGRRRFHLPVPRQLPPGIAPYGGSAHFLISRGAVEYLFEFLARRPDVLRFYRHTWMPDEMLFATLLRNAPFAADDVIDENLWFIDWPPGGVKHPNVLSSADAPALLAAAGRESDVAGTARSKLLARKFDTEVDAKILDILDEHATR